MTPLSPCPPLTYEEASKFPAFGEIPLILDPGIVLFNDGGPTESSDFLTLPQAISETHSVDSCGTFGPRSGYSQARHIDFSEIDIYDVDAVPDSPASTVSACSTLQRMSPLGNKSRDPSLSLRTSTTFAQLSVSYSVPPREGRPTLAHARSVTALATLGLLSSSRSCSPSPSYLSRTRSKSSENLSVSANRSSSPFSLLDPSFSWSTVSGGTGFLSPSPSQASCESTNNRKARIWPGHWSPPSSPTDLADERTPTIPRTFALAQVRPRTVSAETSSSGGSSGSAASCGHNHTKKTPSPTYTHGAAQLPSTLSWLEHLVIQIKIDQEGFRAASPCFKPSAYSSSSGHTNGFNRLRNVTGIPEALTTGMVEFRPIRRHSFLFHHAALESSPVLRQLFVPGGENKDYLARQASLCIKQNGVYVVKGTEVSELSVSTSPHSSQAHHHVKFDWRFEYVVNDRKGSLGKPVPGEKLLTPLCFACSPGLLHPIYGTGKKMNVIHQVKKAVLVQNLSSERMHAPTPPDVLIPRGGTQSPAAIEQKLNCEANPEYEAGQAHRPTHRRFHSAATTRNINGPMGAPDVPTDTHILARARSLRRHRAASIADHPVGGASANVGTTVSPVESGSERRRSFTSPAFKVVRHIIPPAELDELITQPVPASVTRRVGENKYSPPGKVTALSPPRPRQHTIPSGNVREKEVKDAGVHRRPKGTVLRRLSWRS